MITILLEIREIILKTYQKVRFIVNPAVKFLFSIMVFSAINTDLGFNPKFTGVPIVLAMAAVSAVTPSQVLVLFAAGLTLLHIYAVNLFVAILLLLIYVVLYALLLRFSPKHVAVAVVIPVLAKYNLHYSVPILMGSTSNPITILPTICGVIVYHLIDVVKVAAGREVELNLEDVVGLYTDVFDQLMDNYKMIMMIVVFALVITVVWFIRRFSFDYSFQISLGAGVLVNILGFLIADLKYDVTVSVGTLIIMSLLSGIIAMFCDYMKRILDYTAVERVQFEDDDYYYYVKAVPKVNISLREMDVKHFNRSAIDGDEYEYEEETEDEDYEPDNAYEQNDVEEEEEDLDVKEYEPKDFKSRYALLENPDATDAGTGIETEDGYSTELPDDDREEDYYEEEMLLDDDEETDEEK
ncbi:MAG: hypothetical protein J5372_05500 [Lachnospiraceae bacterium]|nr:hypothetical protein [Lachnospiraceae bacterium]MBR4145682.1 hypothetical protein [Lachnospiraceae bacterium]MBR4781729.1 hypothetical protein [Lachnospiraceae bacterium]MBR6474452.1 hypothetical protein [Lachnospiraceae bacterium]